MMYFPIGLAGTATLGATFVEGGAAVPADVAAPMEVGASKLTCAAGEGIAAGAGAVGAVGGVNGRTDGAYVVRWADTTILPVASGFDVVVSFSGGNAFGGNIPAV